MPQNYNQGDEPVPGSGYRLMEFLGRGGFGEVWKASAPGGAEAALKIIRLGGTEGRKEFRALQLVKRIRHPNLVPIIAFWLKSRDGQILDDAVTVQEGLPLSETSTPGSLQETMVAPVEAGRAQATELIIAMGLGDISLFDRLQQCRQKSLQGIPQEELLKYMEDAAEAIDFLNSPVHDLGSGPVAIQHCDIKPHNLMTVGGAAQICDFGLARMMGADRTTTAAATIAYAAPECLVSGRPSASTDQYSLAVSYYELKTGNLPYHDETLATVMDAKRQGRLDFSEAPPAERTVLRRATSQNPEDRYPSASKMVQAVRRASVLGGEPTRETVEFRPRRKRPIKRLVLLVVLAGVALAGWMLWPLYGDVLLARLRGLPGEVEVPPPPPPGLEEAEALADKGETAQAMEIYAQVIRSGAPEQVKAKAHFGRGRCHLTLAQYDDAIDEFKRAAEWDSDGSYGYKSCREYAEAHFLRGMDAADKKQYPAAIGDFEEAMQLDPDGTFGYRSRKEYADAYLQHGTAFLRNGDSDQAIVYLQGASEHDSANPLIFVRLAGAWFAKREFEKVIQNLDRALKIEQNDTDFLNRGLAYRELDDLESAIRDFTAAADFNPQNAAAFASRGEAYLRKAASSEAGKDAERAVADLTEAIRLCRENADANFPLATAYLWRASSYILAAENDRAADDFSAMIELDPNNLEHISHEDLATLARAFANDGEYAKAAEWIRKAIQLSPDQETRELYGSRLKRYQAGNP